MIIYFRSIPELTNKYEHVINFKSSSNRDNYFLNKSGRTIDCNIKPHAMISSITIPLPHDEVYLYDYLCFRGIDNRMYFYFILSVNYNTPSTTIIEVELDVFTTYMFDYQILPSYVDRCHVPRWKNGHINKDNISVDEGFPTFDYVVSTYGDDSYNLLDNGTNIYVTSTPLHEVGTGGSTIPDLPSTSTPVKTTCIASNGDIYTYPTTGTITAGTPSYPSGGNATGGGAHYGIDIANIKGTPIYAPYVGTIIAINEGTTDYGNNVRMTCDNQGNGETYHLFGHLQGFSDVKVGQRVTKSTVIGYMGSTGNSTGSHCHWEISPNGTFNTTNFITGDADWKVKYLSVIQ